MDKKEAIQLSDCEIKKARRGEKMEVVLKGSTTISGSPKKIQVSSVDFEDDKPVVLTLQELQSTDEYEKVSIEVKVIKVTIPETVGTGKRKQDVIVADGTGTV